MKSAYGGATILRQNNLKIGRAFGIDIHLDWSWLLIFALVTGNFLAAFNDLHADWSVATSLTTAVIGALLFFGSVLAHEFAHSLMAKRLGIPVKRITLFLFGGVAGIEKEPDTPKSEFWITIVGPVLSVGLGIILLTIASVVAEPLSQNIDDPETLYGSLSPLSTLLVWLGSINLVLGIFNMIPGLPLDGGRILRSAVWAITGNRRLATQWASIGGRVLAWTFIFAGISMVFGANIPIFGTGTVSGLWLVFIGWFLNSAATQSYQRVAITDALRDIRVASIMQIDAPTVAPTLSVSTLVERYVLQHNDGTFAVVSENDELQGLITFDDIQSVERDNWEQTTVAEIMTPTATLQTAAPEDKAAFAWEKLQQQGTDQLPVLRENNILAGILRSNDFARWLRLQSNLD